VRKGQVSSQYRIKSPVA